MLCSAWLVLAYRVAAPGFSYSSCIVTSFPWSNLLRPSYYTWVVLACHGAQTPDSGRAVLRDVAALPHVLYCLQERVFSSAFNNVLSLTVHLVIVIPCRFLKTCSGRKIPFKIPPAGQNPSKALVKHIKEAERSSVSLMLLSCMGDVERLVAAAVYRACGNLQGSLRSSSAGGGTADGRGSGALEPGSLAAPGDDDRPDRHQAARVSAAAGRTQILAGAAAGPLHAGAGQGIRNGSAAGSGPAVSTAAGAACGAGPAAMAAGGGGPRAPGVTTCDAPGRLLPADAAGAPSGFGLRGAEEGSAEQQRVRCVAVGGQQVLVEVPSEWALPLLQSCSRKVSQEVSDLLGLAAEGPEPPVYPAATAAGGCGGGSLGAVAAAPEAMQLPFRWWWGSSLDLLQANFFGV